VAKLSKGAKKLFDHLVGCSAGDEIDRTAVLAIAGWSESSLKTYVGKNKISPFLREIAGGTRFKVVKDGSTLTEPEFHAVFTQKGPTTVVLAKGEKLTGAAAEYVLHSMLGRGAVGQVWHAHRRSDKANVAIKIVDPRPDLLSPSVFTNLTRRFERERDNGMQLHHPNVVRILDKGTYDAAPFLVMELGERSAHEIIEKRGALDLRTALTITRQAGEGILHIHQQGCVHRDVKPHNILEFSGQFVMGDLGIVKWSDMNPAFVSAGTVTVDSTRLGSWNYMAPEQQETPHAATESSDVYALGVTLYELLTASVSHPAAFAAGAFTPTGHGKSIDDLIASMVRYAPAARASLPSVLSTIDGTLAALP